MFPVPPRNNSFIPLLRDAAYGRKADAEAKRRLLAATVYSEDSHSSLARSLGTALATGSTLEEAQNWPAATGRETSRSASTGPEPVW